MWQYTGSGSASGISGACDLDRSYKDFLPEIKAGGYNNYGVSGPSMEMVSGKRLVVFNARCEYFIPPTSTMWSATCRWAITAW